MLDVSDLTIVHKDDWHRLKNIEINIKKSIESLEKLDKNRRFVMNTEEYIYFLKGLLR